MRLDFLDLVQLKLYHLVFCNYEAATFRAVKNCSKITNSPPVSHQIRQEKDFLGMANLLQILVI
ncbi:hypothetical protein Ocin01_03342 [Orchesella cincta]|uniref:Uncharacterized protein n=1 Tax=Orchesella cincta TaxID=48709 RepID=A0A1D2NDJ7_ORCCI|nr:hypothetical protein Ocin01_03342 [Orchesella cincta]